MSELLNTQGRFNRSKYIATTLIVTALTFGAALVVGFAMGVIGMGEEVASGAGFVLGICGQVVLAFVCVKRLHDLNRPGWHFWLLLVPIYNLYLSVVMLFSKGTEGPNEYGPAPTAA